MTEALHVALFWLAVVIAVRVAVCFPTSLFARVLFSRHGPARGRDEPEADFLRRLARCHGGWLAQSAGAFGLGSLALAWEPSLGDSLYFLVLWAAVIPALALAALVATLRALVRAYRLRRVREQDGIPADANGNARAARP